jgi:ABC-type glycerol-3-phosphate transport system permease component
MRADDAAGRSADSEKRGWAPVCAELGIRDPAAPPLVMVFLFFQRQIIEGIATTGFGGQ